MAATRTHISRLRRLCVSSAAVQPREREEEALAQASWAAPACLGRIGSSCSGVRRLWRHSMADEDLYGELDLYGDLPAPPPLAQPAPKPKPVPTPAAGASFTRARARDASPRGCNARLAQSLSRPVHGLCMLGLFSTVPGSHPASLAPFFLRRSPASCTAVNCGRRRGC